MFVKFALALLFIVSFGVAANIAVIVHPSNANTLDEKQINRIFLGKQKSFPNGEQVVPINLSGGSDVAGQFNQKVLKKSSSQITAYWSKLVFTGKGVPPKEVDNDGQVLELVSTNPNTIGYVQAGSVTDKVKVIATF